MATRLYFGNGVTPPITPAVDASWEFTSGLTRRVLEPSKGNTPDAALESLASGNVNTNSPAGAVDAVVAQYISAPLSGNQTISGTVAGQMRMQESNAAADMRVQCVIRVLSNDGTTVRGTLIASNAGALAHEFNTSLRNISIPLGGSTAVTSVNALDGDRIVVELGARKHESATTARVATLSSGNPSGTDLAVDETTTTANVPWIEFSAGLTFKDATARITQEPARVAVLPTDAAARVTQEPVRVATLPTSAEARVTQLPVRVAVRQTRFKPERRWGVVID